MLNVALTYNIIRCISPKTSKKTDLYIPLETIRQRLSRGSSFKTYYVHTHTHTHTRTDGQATWDGKTCLTNVTKSDLVFRAERAVLVQNVFYFFADNLLR